MRSHAGSLLLRMAVLRVAFITGASPHDSLLRPRPTLPAIDMPHMRFVLAD